MGFPQEAVESLRLLSSFSRRGPGRHRKAVVASQELSRKAGIDDLHLPEESGEGRLEAARVAVTAAELLGKC